MLVGDLQLMLSLFKGNSIVFNEISYFIGLPIVRFGPILSIISNGESWSLLEEAEQGLLVTLFFDLHNIFCIEGLDFRLKVFQLAHKTISMLCQQVQMCFLLLKIFL
jgi:hypothetical protein